jgi:predicted nucleic-acid-binding Zn-ribbon protein
MADGKCPNCGSEELYRYVNTPANGWVIRLLPKVTPGYFTVILCRDCGLTRFFAGQVDRERASAIWERLDAAHRPLGL